MFFSAASVSLRKRLSISSMMFAAIALLPALFAVPFVSGAQELVANRVLGAIVESDSVTLYGNSSPLAKPEFDQGAVARETRLDRVVLVLKPSTGQQRALDALTAAQQNPDSAEFHRWLTAEEYGRRFGVSDQDLAKVTGWLKGHGFSVEPVSAGRRLVVFSGTAAMVADAFHTEIHRYAGNGESHIANHDDPQVPLALSPVISGILSLHDYRRESEISSRRPIGMSRVIAASDSGSVSGSGTAARPENTQGGAHYVVPADMATIYDISPLYSGGNSGSGVSIAIVGRSNINLSDVSTFRSSTGLEPNQPAVILDGSNPGLVSGDQDEATLDVEWSGAVAPAAAVHFVVAGSTATTDGVDLSAQYIVNHSSAQVMSTSFGSCEDAMSSGENSFYNSLWQQAASEGISAFVSSGDSGVGGCSGGSSTAVVGGVNGLCSSPYATCVGGTEFNDASGNYWSGTNGSGGGSALGYILEKVWNESGVAGGSGLWSSGGGVSGIYAQPVWQQGVAGASTGGKRGTPDVSLTAASHDGYLVCENGNWYVFGGTSASSPSFAGIMSLVDEKQGGVGQGNANPGLYAMLNGGSNPFHATLSGNNSTPGTTGYTANGIAYNLATGLGSVDANVLVSHWGGGSGGGNGGGSGSTQSFTVTPSVASVAVTAGRSGTFTVAVAGTGGFTGNVALKATAPAGVSVSFSPASVKAGAKATATVSVSSGAASGSVTITGTSGSVVKTASVSLTVAAAPSVAIRAGVASVSLARGKSTTLAVTVTTGGSFSAMVKLGVTGLPNGVTASWSPGALTMNGTASANANLVLTATRTATVTAATITLTATGGGLTATTTSVVHVTLAPAATLSLSAMQVSMESTGSQRVTVTLSPLGGLAIPASLAGVKFTVTGLPTGVTAQFGTPVLTGSVAARVVVTLTGSAKAVASRTTLVFTGKMVDAKTGVLYSAQLQNYLTVSKVVARRRILMVGAGE